MVCDPETTGLVELEHRGKIAHPLGRCGHGGEVHRIAGLDGRIRRVGILQAFPGEEPEDAIAAVEDLGNIHRPTRSHAVLIVVIGGPWIADLVRVKRIRRQVRYLVEIVRGAVEVVGAGLGDLV